MVRLAEYKAYNTRVAGVHVVRRLSAQVRDLYRYDRIGSLFSRRRVTRLSPPSAQKPSRPKRGKELSQNYLGAGGSGRKPSRWLNPKTIHSVSFVRRLVPVQSR